MPKGTRSEYQDILQGLSGIDSLIIIHGDFLTPSDSLVRSVAFASFYLDSVSKPVVAIPNENRKALKKEYPEELTKIWQIVSPDYFEDPQSLLACIARKARKPVDELRLGLSGMLYSVCVANFGYRISQNYSGPNPMILEDDRFPEPRAYSAIVFKSLCL